MSKTGVRELFLRWGQKGHFTKENSQRFCSISPVSRSDSEQMGWGGNQTVSVINSFHLWPPKYKKSSCGCKQLGLKGYCSVIQRCFGPHLPCLQKVIAPPPRWQVHLIPGKLVRNHPQCFKHYPKPFFFPNQLVLDRTGLRVHLHGQNWGEDEARIWRSWVCGIPGQLRNNMSDCNLDLIWGCCILTSLTLLR